ncbi:5-formyltetrahydrofolate cyclo-ligase [Bosea sp. 117]|uniref:5-formyltetrahydrofolate cyclo-ligase n=1 Tax=Bosea sp. 117 TaxID=1125973 RepID=UPI0009DE1219|nr:5-formyltetrahydrofolate cyclo-ligase [Bosea sp. 117]
MASSPSSPGPSTPNGTAANGKTELRALALARRAALSTEARARASEAAARNAMAWLDGRWLDGRGRGTVALFAPIGEEIDTTPLADLLRGAGARLALPVVTGRERPLLFREWRADEPLVASAGPGRSPIPAPPDHAAEVEPDVLVVPLAAFDARGHRLGYGAGFYDRTLALLRASKRVEAIGYAFAVQELPALPDEPHDEPLDAIATDAGLIRPCDPRPAED